MLRGPGLPREQGRDPEPAAGSPGPWSAPEPPAAPPTGWWLLSLLPGPALQPPGPPALPPTHMHLSGPTVLWDMEGLRGRGMWGCRGPHPLPQVFSLCTLDLQLLPPLSSSRVGVSKGPRQPLVAVLEREELGLPLDLPHGAAGKTLGWGCARSGRAASGGGHPGLGAGPEQHQASGTMTTMWMWSCGS